MSKIDDDFAKLPEDVRLGYFSRAVTWYMTHRKGQPSLQAVKELAATFWHTDELVKPYKKRESK